MATLWTTADIARELGLADAAVARSFIRRAKLEAVGRAIDTGEKQYDPAAVRAARDAMPGTTPRGGRPKAAPSER